MKTISTIILAIFFACNLATAQDTMYVYRAGTVISKQAVADVDSVIFYKPITPPTAVVTDIDGNVYHTVTIGTQTWMVENLKTTKYNDGTSIPFVTDAAAWGALTTPGYCFYNNDAANKTTYGALYNWYTVNTGKLAPTDWHVPTDAEWTILENYLIANGYNYDGTTTGNKIAKSLAATTLWYTNSTNTGAIGNDLTKNNTSGFAGLPGSRRGSNGMFYPIGGWGYWWSSSEDSTGIAWYRYLTHAFSYVSRYNNYEQGGLSVRCVRDDNTPVLDTPTLSTTAASDIASTSATCAGTITSNGGAPITASGVCWSTSTTPTTANNKTTDGTTSGSFTSSLIGLTSDATYYVRAYATNSVGTAYGNEVSFKTLTGSVTDIDGNVYTTVTIGTQVWMVENLKTTKYNDGTNIPIIVYNTNPDTQTIPGYCWYQNKIANKSPYGALYNWFSIGTGKLAPIGWHIPSDNEWEILINFVGINAGSKLKETGTINWVSPNEDATNETGFTAIPVGGFVPGSGSFLDFGNSCYLWSSSSSSDNEAWGRVIRNTTITAYSWIKGNGFSVRCVKDPLTLPTLNTTSATEITQTAASIGGNISYDGGAAVTARGVCWSTSSTPTTANSKTSDGTGTGAFTSSITGLTASTTYYVRAYATNSVGTTYGNEVSFTSNSENTVTDIDGNIYHTVNIGTQTWMVENLKTTKYNDGTSIPNVTDATAWASLSTPGYCFYNNDAANKTTYGALYNWYTVNTGNLAPTGWHVPTDAEWTTLENYLIANGYNYDGTTTGNKIAKSLAATTHWNTYTTVGTIGNDLTKNNTSGFAGLPGGYRYDNGPFNPIGFYGGWWSSTQNFTSSAWFRILYYSNSFVDRSFGNKQCGFSVRCVRDF